MATMTKELIESAQKAWGDGIVRIAAAHTVNDNFEQVARNHVETLYAYGLTPVLFKPTLAAEQQFRSTFDDALSYFVATNNACPEDKGFAIKGWTAVRFENVDILTEGKVGMAMGNYFFTTPEGDEVKVEYSFGYILDDAGAVRINLHHSSMPYAA
ncbi:MAG: phosphoribosyl-AMP cyclohydrolase [Myxococcota bacterium]|nr:phosphoribosyl-AMP cyclohydrolase [Myxococcota bacterium]